MTKKLGRTATYYKYGTTVPHKKGSNTKRAKDARKKKAETSKKSMTGERYEKRKKFERDKYKKKGNSRKKNPKGKDYSHTSSGLKLKKSSSNRGSKSDMPGDRRARSKGRKKGATNGSDGRKRRGN